MEIDGVDLFYQRALHKEEEVHSIAATVEQIDARILKLTRDAEKQKRLHKELELELETIEKECKTIVVSSDELAALKRSAAQLKAQRAEITAKIKSENEAHGEICLNVSKVWKTQKELKNSMAGTIAENRGLQLKVNDLYHKQRLAERQIARFREKQAELKESMVRGEKQMEAEASLRTRSIKDLTEKQETVATRVRAAEVARESATEEYNGLLVERREYEKEISLRDIQIKELEAKIKKVVAATDKMRKEDEAYQRKYHDLLQNKQWFRV